MRGRVSYGIGGTYLYTTLEPTAATQHTVELPDLAPLSTYDFRVDSSSGKATATASGRVTTVRRRSTRGSTSRARTSPRTARSSSRS